VAHAGERMQQVGRQQWIEPAQHGRPCLAIDDLVADDLTIVGFA